MSSARAPSRCSNDHEVPFGFLVCQMCGERTALGTAAARRRMPAAPPAGAEPEDVALPVLGSDGDRPGDAVVHPESNVSPEERFSMARDANYARVDVAAPMAVSPQPPEQQPVHEPHETVPQFSAFPAPASPAPNGPAAVDEVPAPPRVLKHELGEAGAGHRHEEANSAMSPAPRRNERQTPPRRLLALAAVIVALLAGGGYLIYKRANGPMPDPKAVPTPPPKQVPPPLPTPTPTPSPAPALAPVPAPVPKSCDNDPFPEMCKQNLEKTSGVKP